MSNTGIIGLVIAGLGILVTLVGEGMSEENEENKTKLKKNNNRS